MGPCALQYTPKAESVVHGGVVSCVIWDTAGVTFAHIASALELSYSTQPHDTRDIVFKLQTLELLFAFNYDQFDHGNHPRHKWRPVQRSGWAREERFEKAPEQVTLLTQHPRRPWQQRDLDIQSLIDRTSYGAVQHELLRHHSGVHPVHALEEMSQRLCIGLKNLHEKYPDLKE